MSISLSGLDLPSGVTLLRDSDADEDATESHDVMKGPCRLDSLHYKNGDASVNYVKLYDNVDPTIGTAVPDFVFMLPASVEDTIPFPVPLIFENGLSWAMVTTGGTGGVTGPTAASTISVVARKGVA